MSCHNCGGAGWIIREVNGREGAERCECNPLPAKIKPAIEDIAAVVTHLATSKVLPFFPETPEAAQLIVADMSRYVEDLRSLRLFAEKLVQHGKPYEGPLSLRQIYCAYCTPADGYYPEPLPGFETETLEARHKMLEGADREREVNRLREEALEGPPENRGLFPLPEVKTLE
jgi:hypothetical protein